MTILEDASSPALESGNGRAGYAPISDYAMISNCRASALISRDGSIDWLCAPEPHSPSIFGLLLDDERGGCWWIRPDGIERADRRYLEGTCVLETTFHCASGVVRLTDLMQLAVPGSEGQHPDHELARRIECIAGSVRVRCVFEPRPDYGRGRVRFSDCGSFGLHLEAGRQSLLLRSELDLERSGDALVAEERLDAGQSRWMAIGQTPDGPQVAPMIGRHAESRMAETVRWWRSWSDGCQLPGVAPDLVRRSAITLKSLAYPPTGAILAAPTTSLPEELGGSRNWDYRYCWIRDASFTMRAMLNLGVHLQAQEFLSWLMHATQLTRPRLRVLYDVHGRNAPREREVRALEGYMRSAPVRIGNGARDQLQLDTYGTLLDAAWQFHHRHRLFDRAAGRLLRGFAGAARDLWREPDSGIWEIRSHPRHHALSKAMCWVAMDRALRLADGGVLKIDRERWEREAEEIRQTVQREGFNERLGSYTATLGGEEVDASLLLLSIYGFERADSARMNGTIDRIYAQLGGESHGNGAALLRYAHHDDGVPGKEGRFCICGFWGVEALARAGRIDEARENFDALLAHVNDVGLLAEEFDIADGIALGNFPQALSHVGLINAACSISRAGQTDPHEPCTEGS